MTFGIMWFIGAVIFFVITTYAYVVSEKEDGKTEVGALIGTFLVSLIWPISLAVALYEVAKRDR